MVWGCVIYDTENADNGSPTGLREPLHAFALGGKAEIFRSESQMWYGVCQNDTDFGELSRAARRCSEAEHHHRLARESILGA